MLFDFIKIKNVYASKNIIKRVKISSTDWVDHVCEKGLVFKISN